MINIDLTLAPAEPPEVPAPPQPLAINASYQTAAPPAPVASPPSSIALHQTMGIVGSGDAVAVSSDGGNANAGMLQTAACTAGDSPGSWVYLNGGTDGILSVASADAGQPQVVIGVIIGKTTITSCTVALGGLVSGVFSGLTPGATYFLGPNGTCAPPPIISPRIQYVQQVGVATGPNTMLLTPMQARIKRCFT